MFRLFLLLATLHILTSASRLASDLIRREDRAPAPGPIPFDKERLPKDVAESSINVEWKDRSLGLDDRTQQTFEICLINYGQGPFYDGLQGNICGGLGWFKGTAGGGIDAYDCYRVCAGELYRWAKKGFKDVKCEFRKGLHDKCWLGYHPMPYTSNQMTYPAYAAPPLPQNATLGDGTTPDRVSEQR